MFGLQLVKTVVSFHLQLSNTLPLVLGGVILYWSGPRHFEPPNQGKIELETHLVWVLLGIYGGG